jgi:hypothetical protein
VDLTTEDIEVVENILPFRRDSRFDCLPHLDEGFVHGKWAKGETTARNEKRFVTEMQQRKINYKNDGIKQIKDLVHIVKVNNDEYPNTCFIDCTTNPE